MGEGSATLAERWDGTSWSTQTTLNPAPRSEDSLAGVSCVSPRCLAVGKNKYTEAGFAQLWNGSEWSLLVENTASAGAMSGISCASSTYCMIIGSAQNGTEVRSWKLRESIGSWTLTSQSLAVPTGATQLKLNGVSCASSTACTAVGSYYHEGSKPLVERWNGTEWSLQSAPGPAEGDGFSAMLAVSCASTSACTTVGEAAEKPTAERWNGSEWSLITPPKPTGAVSATLAGVSCTSSSACTAVGNFKESGKKKKTLAESWNGSEWKVQSSPNPGEAVGNVKFQAVSCLSATSCFATGGYVTKETSGLPEEERTLAETWNGSEWALQSSPNASGAKLDSLPAVSCTSSIACTAVGTAYMGEGSATLAERYE
jgi:hypothetical protein